MADRLSAESLLSGTPSSGQASSALQERDKVQTLFKSAQDGNLQQLRYQVQQQFEGQSIDCIKDGRGRNALHFAAQSGRLQVCEYLLQQLNFVPDARTEDGDTPLDLAAAAGHLDVCQLLAAQGAAPHIIDIDRPQAIHRAAASGHLQVLQWLVQQGTDVDAPSVAGTPLLWAAGSGQDDCVAALLKAGANPDATGADGVSAILMASAAGSSSTVKELIKAGANVNVKAAGAVTALHTAAECGSLDTVSALLAAGADADARDEAGHTALDAAAGEGDHAIIELLLAKTAPYLDNWSVEGVEAHARSAAAQTSAADAPEAVSIPAPTDPDETAAAQHKRKGDEAFVSKDYQAAVDAYSQSLAHSTSNHLPWANRSAAHLQLGRPDLALQDAQIARTITPSYAKAWYREGMAAGQLNQWEHAANAFFSGYQQEPTNKLLAQAFQDAVKQAREHHQKQQTSGST